MGIAAVQIRLSEDIWKTLKYRKDVQTPTWFGIPNRLLEDSLYAFSGDEIKALVYIFSKASQQARQQFKIDINHARRACEISQESLNACVDKMFSIGLCESPRELDNVPPQQTNEPEQGKKAPDSTPSESVQSRTEPNAGLDDGRTGSCSTGQTKQDKTKQDRQTEHSSGMDQSVCLGAIDEFKGTGFAAELVMVSKDLQMRWLKIFPDIKWVINSLEKCSAKRKAKNYRAKPEEMGVIFTAWLFSEHDRPKPKASTNLALESYENSTGNIALVQDLLDENQKKALERFLGKSGEKQ